jgi:hypothetical protein
LIHRKPSQSKERIIDSRTLCRRGSCHAVITPTQFKRKKYLGELAKAVWESGTDHWYIISGPRSAKNFARPESAIYIRADQDGLGAKLNAALDAMPSCVEYFSWISDDDLISAGTVPSLKEAFQSDTGIGLVYGPCNFIGFSGELVFNYKPPHFSHKVVAFGPNLLPQPSVCVRRSSALAVGGYNNNFFHGIDLDMSIRLSKRYKSLRLNETLASWRIHADSTTVSNRVGSSIGAIRARCVNRNFLWNVFFFPFEAMIVVQSVLVGVFFSRKTAHEDI